MNIASRSFAVFTMMSMLFGLAPVLPVRAGGIVAEPGDLIRGTTFSAVYYMGEDGFRYVFPNDKTYFTWYSDFSTVKMITDAELATIQMGGNVTYHPGTRMIKINSDAKTYFVSHGATLQWVTDEATAVALYGDAWNTMIDDVPDGFFGNYTVGDALSSADADAVNSLTVSREFSATSSITDDKELSEYTWIPIEDMTFGGTGLGDNNEVTIYAGQTVKFTNNDSTKHTATADDNSWGTGTLNSGDSFVRRFTTPGTYTYFCSYHPDMTGTIVVEEALTM